MKGRNILPMAIAAVIALGITVAARFLVPNNKSSDYVPQKSKSKIPMPDIPLMVKETKKIEEVMVLVAEQEIKRGTKITSELLSWKKWPKEALQSNFIAKDLKGSPLNNGGDYNLALTMWAGTDVALGVPLAISMLLSYDPIKKEEEEKAKLEAEKKKKEEVEAAKKEEKEQQDFIKPGMRALTFPIEQRSASGLSMLAPGDLVDVLISEQINGKTIVHKYSGMKVLALDGSVKKKKDESEQKNKDKMFGLASSISGAFSMPKNVTLEVKEAFVEKLLKEVGNGSVILSVRNQTDKNAKDGIGDSASAADETDDKQLDSLMHMMSAVSHRSTLNGSQNADNDKAEQQKNIERVLFDMQRRNTLVETNPKTPKETPQSESNKEFVSGKVVSEKQNVDKDVPPKPQSIRITKGMSTNVVTLDEDGKNTGSSGGDGGLGNKF